MEDEELNTPEAIGNENEEATDIVVDDIIADIVSGLADLSDEEVQAKLSEYDLPDDIKDDILGTLAELKGAEYIAGEMPQNADFAKEAEADAQAMADEDNTPVEVTEEDSDGDGDADKKTTEKTEPKDDSKDNDEKDNSSESEDKPHDEKVTSDVRLKNIHENSTNNIAKTLSNYRW